MKRLFLFLFILPVLSFAQKVKINEYDKFIKQRIIEFEPMTILANEKAKVSMTFNSVASTFYLQLSGFGWGVSAINAEQQVIFLFANDSTVSARSVGLQSYDLGVGTSTYKHQYYIRVPEIEALSRNELVAIRKYNLKDYSDMKVSKESALRIKKLSAMFLEELKKAKVLHTLQQIELKDIAKHIGDSVMFCSKVYNARYFENSDNKPTLLDLNSSFSAQPLNTVIWESDRKNFGSAPEVLYNNKDVCISGVVELVNNIPQIAIRRKEQIIVKSPINLENVAHFIGDSVTVKGKIFSGKYLAESESAPTLLNVGAPYPDQLLTVVIEKKDRGNFVSEPENYFLNKEVSISGKVMLYKGKPQIVVTDPRHLVELEPAVTQAVYRESNTVTASNAAKVEPKELAVVEKNAEYPGGINECIYFIKRNLKNPQELEPGSKKTVLVRFLIAKDGTAGNFEIVESAGKSFDKEVIRVLKLMPRWSPSTRNGVPVTQSFVQPVTFSWVDNSDKLASQ